VEWLVGPLEDIPEGRPVLVDAGGVRVGVVRVGDQISAFENRCPHQGGPVCYGEVKPVQEAVLDERRRIVAERFSRTRFTLSCPWHGWSYDALTGVNVCDRRYRLRRLEVSSRGGNVYVTDRRVD
jgi:nitrite reductase (NADH) small subunit